MNHWIIDLSFRVSSMTTQLFVRFQYYSAIVMLRHMHAFLYIAYVWIVNENCFQQIKMAPFYVKKRVFKFFRYILQKCIIFTQALLKFFTHEALPFLKMTQLKQHTDKTNVLQKFSQSFQKSSDIQCLRTDFFFDIETHITVSYYSCNSLLKIT